MTAHVCKPPGEQPPGTVWHCPAPCHLTYQYGPCAISELAGRVLNLWVRIRRPAWTPYGNPAAARQATP
jgi:hypothetical protein